MVTSCCRNTSLKDETVNNIPAPLEQHPAISKLAFTGKKSQALFEIHFGYFDIERVYLSSPSSAYAEMEFEDKIVAY
ncbi:MAG: hypothetical protein LGB70_00755 [Sulfurovum sp.]|nr:hypothetical protein [Sulfurovum sp.]